MEYNNDFRYDLKVGQVAEKMLGDILSDSTIEVKRDLKALITGNIYVEYESRGKKSGITTSEADWYVYVLSDAQLIIIETCKLKKIARKYVGTERDKKGGDSNTSKGVLIPLTDLIKK